MGKTPKMPQQPHKGSEPSVTSAVQMTVQELGRGFLDKKQGGSASDLQFGDSHPCSLSWVTAPGFPSSPLHILYPESEATQMHAASQGSSWCRDQHDTED